MAYENIQVAYGADDATGIAEVSICRPDKLNALNDDTLTELIDAFAELSLNDDPLRSTDLFQLPLHHFRE